MNKYFGFAFLLFSLFLFSGCDLLPAIPTPTELPATITPFPTLTPTATIVWFPPTATPTPIKVIAMTPTLDLHPELGKIILQDPLSPNSHWQTARSAVGGAAFGKDELTVTVAKPKGYIFSLRNSPVLDNFYLEISSSTSLCREADSYGLLFRTASGREYYRLVITCAGNVRVEREGGGYTIALTNWMRSGQVQPGPQSDLRLGIMGRGKEFRIFIAGVYQFSFSDPSFPRGTLGVFARSGGDTAVTVNFKDLVIYALK